MGQVGAVDLPEYRPASGVGRFAVVVGAPPVAVEADAVGIAEMAGFRMSRLELVEYGAELFLLVDTLRVR